MIEVINVGAVADDGTGDHLRDAMVKVNSNFAELANVAIINDTGDHTLELTDNFGYIVIDSNVNANVTIPPHSDVAFPVGASIIVYGIGEGVIEIIAGIGVDLNSPDGMDKLKSKYSCVSIVQIAEDSWILSGDLTS